MKKALQGLCVVLALICGMGATAPSAAKAKTKDAKPKEKSRPAAAPTVEQKPGALPWTLRNHFTFSVGNCSIDYADESAHWRQRMGENDIFADEVGYAITLDNGRVLRSEPMLSTATGRDPFTNELGDGTCYSVRFPSRDGIAVKHRLVIFKERPFAMVQLAVENTGAAPVQVARMSPILAGGNSLTGFRADAQVSAPKPGGAAPNAPGTLAVLRDPSRDVSLGIGVIPSGKSDALADFHREGGAWTGEAACRYTPAKPLPAGDTIESDWVLLSYGASDPAKVGDLYSWAVATMPKGDAR
jgi:hypothetical protein